MSEELKELRESNDILNNPEALRARMDEEGYLFFRQLQDPDKLWELRRQMLHKMKPWLVEGTDPFDGIADVTKQCTEGDLGYTDVYHEVYKLELFHKSAHWPEVLGTVEKIIGRPTIPHPHKVARLWFPKFLDHTTPTHQDFVHFQGNFNTYTAWAPVGNCPIELGGLALLPGSHKVNRVLDHKFSLGAGSLAVDTDDFDVAWHTTNYEIGDTLIFPALTVHKALPNYTEDKLRVSLDNRYQAIEDTMSEHMQTPHLQRYSNLQWEEVYKDWESDDLKYYWKDLPIPTIPQDMSYSEKGFQEALELAKTGNEHAKLHLQRAIAVEPDSAQAHAAKEVLAIG